MTRHHCARCSERIPNGQAHLRSSLFRQVAYCDDCLNRQMPIQPMTANDSAA